MPTLVGTSAVVNVLAFHNTNALPCRPLWRDAGGVYSLVDARSLKKGQQVRLSPCLGGSAASVPSSGMSFPGANTSLVDPAPLRGLAARTAGMDYPSSWSDVLMLETRFDAPPTPFRAASFDALGATFKDWFRGDWRRKNHWVELQTWLLVPTNTVLQFGLAGTAPSWLFVDGSNTLVHPPFQPYDKWTAGTPVRLRAGLRRVRVVTVLRQKIDTGLAWKRPGETAMASDIRMVTGGDLLDGRREMRGETVHPYAVAEERSAYRFTAAPDVLFVPYTLTDKSVMREEKTHSPALWTIDGHPVGSGREFTVTLPDGGTHTAAVEVAGARYAFPLRHSGKVWREDRVSVRVTGIPAYCFDDAQITPILSVRTTAPDDIVFRLSVTTTDRRDGVTGKEYPVTRLHGAGSIYLPPISVSDVARMEWTLLHHGVILDRGELRLPETPYGSLPTAVSGESLKTGSAFLTLVVPRASAWAEMEEGDGEEESSPAGPVALLAEGDSWDALTNHFPLCVLTSSISRGEPSGKGDLFPFTELAPCTNAASILYAPDVRPADAEDLDTFECRVSAMMGVLKSPAMGNPVVTVIIPPAEGILPDFCISRSALARELAERIMRAADAQGLATLDLFTLFQTSSSDFPLLRDGRITPDGASLISSLFPPLSATP